MVLARCAKGHRPGSVLRIWPGTSASSGPDDFCYLGSVSVNFWRANSRKENTGRESTGPDSRLQKADHLFSQKAFQFGTERISARRPVGNSVISSESPGRHEEKLIEVYAAHVELLLEKQVTEALEARATELHQAILAIASSLAMSQGTQNERGREQNGRFRQNNHSKNYNSNNYKSRNNKVVRDTCFHCKKSGHWKRDCPNRDGGH